MKRYGTDKAKSRSRDLVHDMISRTLVRFKKPQQIRVLCFPGIDAVEILQVYDELAIPRENITGLERDSAVHAALVEKNLGINLHKGSLSSFLKKNDRLSFDVISLDYLGPVSKEQTRDIDRIFATQTANTFIFHCANLLRRENYGKRLYAKAYAEAHIDLNANTDLDGSLIEDSMKDFDGYLDMSRAGEMTDEKKDLYSDVILTLSGPQTNACSIFEKLDYPQGTAEYQRWQESSTSFSEEAARVGKHELFLMLMDKAVVQRCMEYHKDSMAQFDQTKFLITTALVYAESNRRVFCPKEYGRYSYISETGAPMVGDVVLYRKPRRIIDQSHEFLRGIGFFGQPVLNKNAFYKYYRELNKFYAEEQMDPNEVEREFLGNSSKPEITKEKAIAEFQGGSSVEEIRARYRGCDELSLPQIKAHVTMGTYGPQRKPKKARSRKAKVCNVDRDLIVSFIKSGMALEDIQKLAPEISIGSLRALKAHVTMGTYDKNPTQN